MIAPTTEFHQTSSLREAGELLRRYGAGARLLAGGTDLLVDIKTSRARAEHLVSIGRIAELKGVTLTDDGLRIGAMTTITELDESPLVRAHFAPIRDATQKMAVRQIRNLATIGGNLASAVPCADLPPILMALGASVELWSPGGVRTAPLRTFFKGVRQTDRREGEILSAIAVPRMKPGFGAAYARFGPREGNAIAVAAVAAGMSIRADDTIDDAILVLSAVAPSPKIAVAASEMLHGVRADADAFASAALLAKDEAEPISDVRGSADFRRALVEVLARRALAQARVRARGEQK